jgi:transcriptional regulator with XRE-family HTH domain
MTVREHINTEFARLRASKKPVPSMDKLATAAGVAKNKIQRIESGEVGVILDSYETMFRLLGATLRAHIVTGADSQAIDDLLGVAARLRPERFALLLRAARALVVEIPDDAAEDSVKDLERWAARVRDEAARKREA